MEGEGGKGHTSPRKADILSLPPLLTSILMIPVCREEDML